MVPLTYGKPSSVDMMRAGGAVCEHFPGCCARRQGLLPVAKIVARAVV